MFLFGLNYMRQALVRVSGDRIKTFVGKAAGNKFRALITGIVITTFIQSSSGVTAIVVALVSAGIMTMYQGIMIMIGANIGTTTTAFLFAFQIEKYGLLIVFFGFFLSYFKNNKLKRAGDVLTGLGLLLLGINIMNSFYANLSRSNIIDYIMRFSRNRFASFFIGTAVSALLQSSSGTINIVQNLFAIDAVNLAAAVSLVLGANLGTTIASLVAAVSATKEAKTAVNVNIAFNLIGGVVFVIFLLPFCDLLTYLKTHSSLIPNKKIMVAYSHLLYNIAATVIFYFLYDSLITKIIKRQENINLNFPKNKLTTP
ncbi:MAG: Na/Pi cotransporter family protein [Acholeplasmataceae bacterium]|nr:Na/Pi cotransporter family protein [Acholeplasmataceae bacterium]